MVFLFVLLWQSPKYANTHTHWERERDASILRGNICKLNIWCLLKLFWIVCYCIARLQFYFLSSIPQMWISVLNEVLKEYVNTHRWFLTDCTCKQKLNQPWTNSIFKWVILRLRWKNQKATTNESKSLTKRILMCIYFKHRIPILRNAFCLRQQQWITVNIERYGISNRKKYTHRKRHICRRE